MQVSRYQYGFCYTRGMQFLIPNIFIVFVIVVAWILWWKGYALWLAARRGERIWFVALLIVNTLGLLEMYYIFVSTKHTWSDILKTIKGTDK